MVTAPAVHGRRGQMLAALALSEAELDRQNVLPAGVLALRIARLRALLRDGRLPRIAAVGRRGAGKSTLLNALAGHEVAHVGHVEDATQSVTFERLEWPTGRLVEWYDTPGLRAGGEPGRAARVRAQLRVAPPDVLLFLCQATEVDAGVADELKDLAALIAGLARDTGSEPLLVGVVTKVDELHPVDVLVPFDDAEKRANIRGAVSLLGRRLRRAGLAPTTVIPVCAYVRYERGRLVESMRWNTDALTARVAELLTPVGEPLGPHLAGDLRAALLGTMEELTDAFAQRAAALAAGRAHPPPAHGPERELAHIEAAMVRLLRALSPAAMPLADALRGASLLSVLRAGAGRLGVLRASGSLAGAQLRSRGAAITGAVARLADASTLHALYAPEEQPP